jgi:hypothetical protein
MHDGPACMVLGIAAEDNDSRHGDKGGREDGEDAGLNALESPVAAGGLVTNQPMVSASRQARAELVRRLEHDRLARGRHAAEAERHPAEVQGGAAVGRAARQLATWPDKASQ